MSDREALLEAFTRAWSNKDLDALMELMAPECEFRSSVGPEPGARFVGPDEVRRGFRLFLGSPGGPVAQTESTGDLVGADFAVTRWTSRSTQPDGSVVEVRACDVFEFESDRIKVKDTYRKVTGPLPAG
jgi:ketosteroid isomerase-like protein